MKGTIKFRDPFLMAAGLLVVFLVILLVHYLYTLIIGETMDLVNIWIYMMGAALVFSMFSTINLLYAQNTARYYYKTIMAFASLLIVGVLLASWISGQSILDVDVYRKIIIFVVIAFLAFISIGSIIKRVEDWSKKKDEDFLNK